jgi:predicted Zn-dependent protease
VSGQSQEPTTLPAPGFDLNDMRVKVQTKAREMTIGRQASRRFERRAKLLQNVAVQEYVNRIAQTVARNSDVQVPVTVKIVDSNEINAISFPGGFLYINSGLISAVDDEAEIAGVIAHEIAHVVARDGMKNSPYLGTGTANPIVVPSVEAGSGLGEVGGFLIPLRFLGSPRETDADRRGIQYMQKAGYDPKGLVAFLEMMRAKDETELDNILAMFQTHPPTADRIRLIQEAIASMPPAPDPHPDTVTDLQQIKALLVRSDSPDREKE